MEHDSWARVEFRKSSYSGGANGECVELAWRKSSYSGGQSGACVEIAQALDLFGVRDSKNSTGPVLEFADAPGRAFVAAVRRGRLQA